MQSRTAAQYIHRAQQDRQRENYTDAYLSYGRALNEPDITLNERLDCMFGRLECRFFGGLDLSVQTFQADFNQFATDHLSNPDLELAEKIAALQSLLLEKTQSQKLLADHIYLHARLINEIISVPAAVKTYVDDVYDTDDIAQDEEALFFYKQTNRQKDLRKLFGLTSQEATIDILQNVIGHLEASTHASSDARLHRDADDAAILKCNLMEQLADMYVDTATIDNLKRAVDYYKNIIDEKIKLTKKSAITDNPSLMGTHIELLDVHFSILHAWETLAGLEPTQEEHYAHMIQDYIDDDDDNYDLDDVVHAMSERTLQDKQKKKNARDILASHREFCDSALGNKKRKQAVIMISDSDSDAEENNCDTEEDELLTKNTSRKSAKHHENQTPAAPIAAQPDDDEPLLEFMTDEEHAAMLALSNIAQRSTHQSSSINKKTRMSMDDNMDVDSEMPPIKLTLKKSTPLARQNSGVDLAHARVTFTSNPPLDASVQRVPAHRPVAGQTISLFGKTITVPAAPQANTSNNNAAPSISTHNLFTSEAIASSTVAETQADELFAKAERAKALFTRVIEKIIFRIDDHLTKNHLAEIVFEICRYHHKSWKNNAVKKANEQKLVQFLCEQALLMTPENPNLISELAYLKQDFLTIEYNNSQQTSLRTKTNTWLHNSYLLRHTACPENHTIMDVEKEYFWKILNGYLDSMNADHADILAGLLQYLQQAEAMTMMMHHIPQAHKNEMVQLFENTIRNLRNPVNTPQLHR